MPWIQTVFVEDFEHSNDLWLELSSRSKGSTITRVHSSFEEGKDDPAAGEKDINADKTADKDAKAEEGAAKEDAAGGTPNTDTPFVPPKFLHWMFGKYGCPCDAYPKYAGPIPECVDKDGDCMDDKAGLEKWVHHIDQNLKKHINQTVHRRDVFQRRACDYKYAQISPDKPLELEVNYGPDGPKASGGSYLYEMHRWRASLDRLTHACDKDVQGCRMFLDWARNHPESIGKHAVLDPDKSKVFKEIKAACHLGKTRSPVPNNGPLWCTGSGESLECEENSCLNWWKHNHRRDPNFVWVDEERAEEYDDLKQLCGRINKDFKGRLTPNVYQEKVKKETKALKAQYCRPRWIHGYCDNNSATEKRGECHLEDGYWCEKGKILDGSLVNDTANWKEKYPEKLFDDSPEGQKEGKGEAPKEDEGKESSMAPLLLPPEIFRLRRRRRERHAIQSFL